MKFERIEMDLDFFYSFLSLSETQGLVTIPRHPPSTLVFRVLGGGDRNKPLWSEIGHVTLDEHVFPNRIEGFLQLPNI